MNINPTSDIIVKFLQGELAGEELTGFQNWMEKDPSNEKMVTDYKQIWAYSSPTETIDFSEDIDDAWESFTDVTNISEPSTIPTKVRSIQPRFTYLKAAAAAIILLIGSRFAYQTFFNESEKFETIATIAQEKRSLLLPDGSEVYLNENSSIAYNFNGDVRSVEFSGEAYFTVAKNPSKPFIITSEGAQVKVIGTAFNLRAYKDEEQVEVSVTEGIVELTQKEKIKNSAQLTIGKTGRYHKVTEKIVTKTDLIVDNATAWKTNKLEFDDTPLIEVITILNRYYKCNIVIPTELNSCGTTGIYEDKSLDHIIKVLEFSLSLKANKTKESIELIGKGCD